LQLNLYNELKIILYKFETNIKFRFCRMSWYRWYKSNKNWLPLQLISKELKELQTNMKFA